MTMTALYSRDELSAIQPGLYHIELGASEMATLQGILLGLSAEWSKNLSRALLVDGPSDISTAEAVLRKIDPLLRAVASARHENDKVTP